MAMDNVLVFKDSGLICYLPDLCPSHAVCPVNYAGKIRLACGKWPAATIVRVNLIRFRHGEAIQRLRFDSFYGWTVSELASSERW